MGRRRVSGDSGAEADHQLLRPLGSGRQVARCVGKRLMGASGVREAGEAKRRAGTGRGHACLAEDPGPLPEAERWATEGDGHCPACFWAAVRVRGAGPEQDMSSQCSAYVQTPGRGARVGFQVKVVPDWATVSPSPHRG